MADRKEYELCPCPADSSSDVVDVDRWKLFADFPRGYARVVVVEDGRDPQGSKNNLDGGTQADGNSTGGFNTDQIFGKMNRADDLP